MQPLQHPTEHTKTSKQMRPIFPIHFSISSIIPIQLKYNSHKVREKLLHKTLSRLQQFNQQHDNRKRKIPPLTILLQHIFCQSFHPHYVTFKLSQLRIVSFLYALHPQYLQQKKQIVTVSEHKRSPAQNIPL